MRLCRGLLSQKLAQTSGTGLLQGLNPFSWVPSGWDWLTEMRSLVAQDDPDVVVAEFIGVYFPPADGSG